MWWLIIFDPEFWIGVAIAAWAQFGHVVVELGLLVVVVAVAICFIYKSIIAKGIK